MGIFAYETGDPRSAAAFANFIGFLNQNEVVTNLQEIYGRIFGTPELYAHFPRTNSIPAHVCSKHAEGSLVIVEGAAEGGQGLAYMSAARENIDLSLDGGANSYLRNLAIGIEAHAEAASVYDNYRTWLVGHSLGGAIVEIMGRRALVRLNAQNLSIVTMGSPKPGPVEVGEMIPFSKIVRWMTPLDPVPYIVPSPSQAPTYWYISGATARNNAARYSQPPGGVLIRPDGTVRAQDYPELTQDLIEPAIYFWLSQQNADLVAEHSIGRYYTYLETRNQRYPAAPPQTGRTHTTARTDPGTPAENRRKETEAVRRLRESVRDAGDPHVVVPPNRLFTAQRNGSIWTVSFIGTVIIVAPSRKRARAFASRGNDLLRRLQPMGAVSTVMFAELFDQYLGFATDPQGGFVPVMRTFSN